jgi:hypothetical protein
VVAELGTKWSELKRQLQEGLVIEFSFVGTAAKWLLGRLPGEGVKGDQVSMDRMNANEALAQETRNANAARFGNFPPANPIEALARSPAGVGECGGHLFPFLQQGG